jgi:membrane-associated phospholipid phosphatase
MGRKHKDRKARRKMQRAAAHLSAPERLDVELAAWVSQWHAHPVVRAAAAAAQVSDQPPLLAIAMAVYCGGLTSGDNRLRLCGERMLAAFVAATMVKAGGKRLVARTRPRAVARRGDYRRKALGPREGEWNAFPSGHAAGAVAVARAVGRSYPELAGAALGVAGLAGLAQVLKGGHFPSDVLAGAALGWAAEAGAERALDVALHRHA